MHARAHVRMCLMRRCRHTLFFATDDLLDDMLTFYNESLPGNLYAYLPLSPILVAFRRRLDERDRHLFFSGSDFHNTRRLSLTEREREREGDIPPRPHNRPAVEEGATQARAHTHTHIRPGTEEDAAQALCLPSIHPPSPLLRTTRRNYMARPSTLPHPRTAWRGGACRTQWSRCAWGDETKWRDKEK